MGTPFAVAASCLRLQQSHAASTRSIEPKVPHVPGAWRPLRGIVPSVRLAKDRVQGSLMFGRADGRRRIASRQSPISWVIDMDAAYRSNLGVSRAANQGAPWPTNRLDNTCPNRQASL